MGGRGRISSGGSQQVRRGNGPEQSKIQAENTDIDEYGRKEGVEYLEQPYAYVEETPRGKKTEQYNKFTPMVSQSGLMRMGDDLKKAGVTDRFANLTGAELKITTKEINTARPAQREEALLRWGKIYLVKTQPAKYQSEKDVPETAAEKQLNTWGLSAETRYQPVRNGLEERRRVLQSDDTEIRYYREVE